MSRSRRSLRVQYVSQVEAVAVVVDARAGEFAADERRELRAAEAGLARRLRVGVQALDAVQVALRLQGALGAAVAPAVDVVRAVGVRVVVVLAPRLRVYGPPVVGRVRDHAPVVAEWYDRAVVVRGLGLERERAPARVDILRSGSVDGFGASGRYGLPRAPPKASRGMRGARRSRGGGVDHLGATSDLVRHLLLDVVLRLTQDGRRVRSDREGREEDQLQGHGGCNVVETDGYAGVEGSDTCYCRSDSRAHLSSTNRRAARSFRHLRRSPVPRRESLVYLLAP
jgi:hypothetical protein